jgi:transposase-like protein
MRKYQPAQVDWDEIKARVVSGEGFSAIAKDYTISRQAIQKRCRNEGWIDGKERTVAVRRELRKLNKVQPEMQPELQPETVVQPEKDAKPVAEVKPLAAAVDRNDKRSAVLELLKQGVPKVHAAQAVGVHENTLTRWMNEDGEFSTRARAAESAAVALRVQRIGKAGEKDWRADSWYLERTQRATFGSDAGKAGGVAVQINIVRDNEPEVVSVTPAG